MRKQHFRSIFISDTHLRTLDCQADLLLEFLETVICDHLYLVGDIIDIWQLKSTLFWPKVMNDIVLALIKKANSGTRVTYIPGNHDELMRHYAGTTFEGIDICMDAVHTTMDGKRLFVFDGDDLDEVVRNFRWVESLADSLYTFILQVSRVYNAVRRRLGYGYWSFAAYIKYKFKNAVAFIERYEEAASALAARGGYDGIVCGHIHHPNNVGYAGVTYLNTGDWVEHCSALVEDQQGIFNWSTGLNCDCNGKPLQTMRRPGLFPVKRPSAGLSDAGV